MAELRSVDLGSSKSNTSSAHQQIPCGPVWRSRYSDSLRVSLFRNLIPVRAKFFFYCRPTGLGNNLASCTMGTRSLSQKQNGQSAVFTTKLYLSPLRPLCAFVVGYRVTFIFTNNFLVSMKPDCSGLCPQVPSSGPYRSHRAGWYQFITCYMTESLHREWLWDELQRFKTRQWQEFSLLLCLWRVWGSWRLRCNGYQGLFVGRQSIKLSAHSYWLPKSKGVETLLHLPYISWRVVLIK
jgi:hypothetical protein